MIVIAIAIVIEKGTPDDWNFDFCGFDSLKLSHEGIQEREWKS